MGALLAFIIVLAATGVDCQICSITSDNDFQESTYEFHHGGDGYKTFDDVRTYCKGQGGDIVVITSKAQNTFIAGRLNRGTPARYWISLSNNGTNITTNGSPDQFNNWASCENTNCGSCVIIRADKQASKHNHGKWESRKCSLPHRYICQIGLPNRLSQSQPQCSWQLFGDSYYRFVGGTKANFTNARKHCNAEGGDLAVIRSDALNTHLTAFITPPLSRSHCYWIGLRKDKQDHTFTTWIDGTPLNDSDANWATNEPNNNEHDCACLLSYNDTDNYQGHGRWNDTNCTTKNPFICQRDRLLQGNWTQLENTQYMVTSHTSTYSDAREYCQQLGGTLAQPKTQEIQELLEMPGSIGGVWIGLDDLHTEGVFRWADGTLLNMTGYAAWASDNPHINDGGNKDCVMVDSNRWNDSLCNETFKAACERSRVLTDCPAGRFGAECTEHCNCAGGGSCDKDSGYCTSSDGECQTGFIHNSAVYPESCSDYTGCFASCSETCHCLGGFDDCNLINGECVSSRYGRCHPRWMGENCQTDRFHTVSAKSNPGTAAFSCAVSSSDTLLSAEDIKAVVGNFSSDVTVPCNNSGTQNLTRNNKFFIENVDAANSIYCFFGDPSNATGFAFVKLPNRTFYVLPSLTKTPTVSESGLTYAVVQWRAWNSTVDSGDGPIIGYKIYIRNDSGDPKEITVSVLPSGEVQTSGGSRKKRAGSEETNSPADGTDLPAMLQYNIIGLSEGTIYVLQMAVVREGPRGEGKRGNNITFTTIAREISSTTPLQTTTLQTTASPLLTTTSPLTKQPRATEGVASSSIVPAVGGLFGAVILILVIVIVVILLRRKRAQQASDKPTPALHLQVLNDPEGQSDDCGEDIPPVLVQWSPNKPAIAVKPRLKQANSTDSVDGSPAKASPGPSVLPMPSSKRRPIPAAAFPAFVHKHRHTSFFSEEFKDLSAEDIHPQTVARKEKNDEKNRYKNILPYDSGRVVLQVLDGDPHSDFYNASYISSFDRERVYIASQAPNKASMDDFWRMLWQENIRTIAMVTNLQEGRKVKCKQYWPENPGDSEIFGSIKVKLVSLEPCTGGQKRKMVIQKELESEQRTIQQFHYTEWPDKSVPKHVSSLLKFIKEVKADHAQNTNPLLIHCSAGVGRTGVVIGIDSVVAHARQTREVDVFNFVSSMRERRPFMVQTQEQYAFLYGAVLESLLWRDTSIPLAHFTDHLRHLRLVEGGRSHLVREYETLNSLCPDPPESLVKAGKSADNRHKNRYGNNVPLDRNRVFLKQPGENYINASFVKGARYRFLTTQTPMPTTVTDFWTMILDYGPLCIVMMNDMEPTDKSYAEYWSDEGLATFGSYKVSTTVASQQSDVIIRTMEVTRSGSKAGHRLTHLQLLKWPKKAGPSQTSAKGLLSVIESVKSSLDLLDDSAILVHCMSGVGRTGVFCSAMECIAQVAKDESIDVFQTVKMLRADRAGLVQTEDEYSFLYDVICMYLQINDYEQTPYDQEKHMYGNTETVPTGQSLYEELEREQPGPDAMYGNIGVDGSHGLTPSIQLASAAPRDMLYENFGFQS